MMETQRQGHGNGGEFLCEGHSGKRNFPLKQNEQVWKSWPKGKKIGANCFDIFLLEMCEIILISTTYGSLKLTFLIKLFWYNNNTTTYNVSKKTKLNRLHKEIRCHTTKTESLESQTVSVWCFCSVSDCFYVLQLSCHVSWMVPPSCTWYSLWKSAQLLAHCI